MDETLVHRTSYSLDDPPIEPFDDVTEATTYDDDDVINEPYDVIGGTATSDVTANYDVMKREEAGVKKKVSDGGFVIDKESREDQPNNVFSVSDESGSSSSESIVASLCSQIRNRVSQVGINLNGLFEFIGIKIYRVQKSPPILFYEPEF